MKLPTIVLSMLALTGGALALTTARPLLQEAPQPGPEHAVLEMMAGEWDAEIHMMGSVEKGHYSMKPKMNGLWLVSEFEGEMMGSPFLGHEVLGWDSNKKKYVSVWVDSMTTSMALSEGTWDAEKKVMTMVGESVDPMGGGIVEMRNITTFVSDDHMQFDMHMGGGDAPAMTIHYKRKE